MSARAKTPRPHTAAALRALRETAATELADTRAALAQLTARTGAISIDAPDDLATHEAAIATAERETARLEAKLAELDRRIAEADTREHDARIDAAIAENETLVKTMRQLALNVYLPHAQAIVPALVEMRQAQRTFDDNLREIERAGRRGELADKLGWDMLGVGRTDAFGLLHEDDVVRLPDLRTESPLWGSVRGEDITAPRYKPEPDPSHVTRPAGVYHPDGRPVDPASSYPGQQHHGAHDEEMVALSRRITSPNT